MDRRLEVKLGLANQAPTSSQCIRICHAEFQDNFVAASGVVRNFIELRTLIYV